jgi:hypothetical protein
MITTDEGLKVTAQQLTLMARALEASCEQELPRSRQMFALMAEGPLDQIQRLLDEINEYVGSWVEEGDTAGTHAA